MSKKDLKIGDLVEFLSTERTGMVGIISQPISAQKTGHVLVHIDGFLIGIDAGINEVRLVEEGREGFAQLGYLLIKLGSHVIEKKLLGYHALQ